MPDIAALIQDILDTHHRYLYAHMPALDVALQGAPAALADPWRELVMTLEDHLNKEEEVLFPAMIGPHEEAGDLEPILAAMRAEHEQIRGIERALRSHAELAGPHEAALVALLDDLAVHADREDRELFPAWR